MNKSEYFLRYLIFKDRSFLSIYLLKSQKINYIKRNLYLPKPAPPISLTLRAPGNCPDGHNAKSFTQDNYLHPLLCKRNPCEIHATLLPKVDWI